jgi:hypothetical protein
VRIRTYFIILQLKPAVESLVEAGWSDPGATNPRAIRCRQFGCGRKAPPANHF